MIHDDSESDPDKSRNNEMTHHKKQITCLSIKSVTSGQDSSKNMWNLDGVVASCSEDSSILLTNLSSYRIEGQPRNTQEPYKIIKFLSPHDCLVAADGNGCVYFLSYLSDRKFDVCFKKMYYSVSQTDNQKTELTPVTAFGFDYNLG